MVGSANRLVPDRIVAWQLPAYVVVLALITGAGQTAEGQSLYKYRGDNGEWIYSDRPPEDEKIVEVRGLDKGTPDAQVSVALSFVGDSVELLARNDYYVPIEVFVVITSIRGLEFPDPDQELKWVLPPRSDTQLLHLEFLQNGAAPLLEYTTQFLTGDPDAQHRPTEPYRVPIAISNSYRVTQSFPNVATHATRDSYFAVDLGLPIGTDIFAARGGIVFDVASKNFQGGLDLVRDAPLANIIKILHDDGTYALYAHLNWNSIRVKPGDSVQRGEYIADSGNTGFSSGPHLHFAVLKNAGMWLESVPIEFMGANSEAVVPVTGKSLTAY
jgi:murein DD-endopeptidase MepM/ murein hydrolase activator NlpD